MKKSKEDKGECIKCSKTVYNFKHNKLCFTCAVKEADRKIDKRSEEFYTMFDEEKNETNKI